MDIENNCKWADVGGYLWTGGQEFDTDRYNVILAQASQNNPECWV